MITVKLGELKGIVEGLNDILLKELPIKPAYWLGKIGKAIHKELAEFEENRMNLIKKHALRDEKGEYLIADSKYQFADEEAFAALFNELATTEIEIDFNPLPLDKLGDINISPVTLMRLDKFIVVGE